MASRAPLAFSVSPRRVAVTLGAVAAALVAAHLALLAWKVATGDDAGILVRFFHLSIEGNLPTSVSALYLLIASVLLGVIAGGERRAGGRFTTTWAALSAGFLFLAVDEAAGVHDQILNPVLNRHVFDGFGEGALYFRWAALFVPVVAAVAVLSVPFLRALPRHHAVRFVVAGVVYVGGALGIEFVEGALMSGDASWAAVWLSQAVEEGAEMAGAVLFIWALLEYLREAGVAVTVRLEGPPAPGPFAAASEGPQAGRAVSAH